jgi:septum formation inhibitor-activating ATPase MinD
MTGAAGPGREEGGAGQAAGREGRERAGVDPVPQLVRLAVGLGDPEREGALLPRLARPPRPQPVAVVVAQRCLSADDVVGCVRAGRADAVLVAFDLHRLTRDRLDELLALRVPLVLLTPGGGGDAPQAAGLIDPAAPPPAFVALSLEAPADAVLDALARAVRQAPYPAGGVTRRRQTAGGAAPATRRSAAGRAPIRPAPAAERTPAAGTAAPAEPPPATLTTIAVAGGPGGPGCTTVAINLAVALGAVAPTVCVDASRTPSVAAYLDADPARGIFLLAHGAPETGREWERGLQQELQPLDRRSPHGVFLAGVPKPEMWSGVGGDFVVRLLAELRQRFRFVVLDVGHRPPDSDSGPWGAAVAGADQVLFVTASDLVGIWRARPVVGNLLDRERLRRRPDGEPAVALVLNKYDRRHHHSRQEVEWNLRLPAAAVIPFDHGGVERAIAAQRPVVLDARSRAGRALIDLAERVHGGRVVLPPEAEPAPASPSGPRAPAPAARAGAADAAGWLGRLGVGAWINAVAARLGRTPPVAPSGTTGGPAVAAPAAPAAGAVPETDGQNESPGGTAAASAAAEIAGPAAARLAEVPEAAAGAGPPAPAGEADGRPPRTTGREEGRRGAAA